MNFEKFKLGDVVEEITVGHVGPMASEYVASGIPFLRSQNVLPFGVSTDDIRYISPMFHARLKKSRLRPGDVVIVRTGKPGTCAVIPEWLVEANCSDLVIVRSSKHAHPRYIAYWVNSLAANHISGSLVGAVQQHFNVGAAREMPILLPSLHDQLRVLEVLGSLDDKIELNRRMNETLGAMAQAVFRDWFVDFGPTRRKLEGATDPVTITGGLVQDAERAQALASLFLATVDDDGIPMGWQEATLEAYASLNPDSWGAKTAPAEIEYVDLANTKWGTIESTALYSWEDAPSRARRIIRAGDTIVGTVRPGNGSYAYVGRDGLTASTGFAVLRPRHPALSEFVNCAATSAGNIERLDKLADGGAYPAVRPEVVLATAVPLVSKELASAFHVLVAPMFQKIELSKEESATLTATRDLLLPKLMSGEVRLREAEEMLEAVQ